MPLVAWGSRELEGLAKFDVNITASHLFQAVVDLSSRYAESLVNTYLSGGFLNLFTLFFLSSSYSPLMIHIGLANATLRYRAGYIRGFRVGATFERRNFYLMAIRTRYSYWIMVGVWIELWSLQFREPDLGILMKISPGDIRRATSFKFFPSFLL